MSPQAKTSAKRSIRLHLAAGVALAILLVGGVGTWAATMDISGAVIAQGTLAVDSSVKKVQHPSGGIVGEISVRDGDQVTAGDIVLRLDDTVARANLAITTKSLTELQARKARLEAERDGAEAITFPQEMLGRSADPTASQVMSDAQKLFELRRTARLGQKSQLRERIAQMRQEITGLEAQAKAKAQEIVLIQRELTGARDLWKKGLMPITKLTSLERETTRVEGERANLIATVARSKGQIAETELKIIQIDRDLASEVAKELREIDGKIGELVERQVAGEDQLKRIDIRAPQDGIVHQSTVHTVGGVIGAGDTLMLIVPRADNLIVEAKVAPRDIDQLRIGQPAKLRFPAFNQRTTPEINGTLTRIAADVTTEERTGQSYYTVRIAMAPDGLAALGTLPLVVGMPVEAFIQTGERRVISYLVKPLSDQVMRAFREQ